MSRKRIFIILCTIGAALTAGACFAIFYKFVKCVGPPEVVSDVSSYPETLSQWSASGLVEHFPASVPPQASKVRFAAFPGFLQGGAYIQLRMQLPADDIHAIEDQLKGLTTLVYSGGGFFPTKNWPTTTFHTSDNPQSTFSFPMHYTLYVLSAKDRSGGSWNHGETSGAAISTTNNEVIYWADAW